MALGAYENQAYPFDRLVEQLGVGREMGKHPIFDVMVDMVNFDFLEAGDSMGGVRVQPFEYGYGKSKFDLTIYIYQMKDSLALNLGSTDLFEADTMEQMAQRLGILLDSIIGQRDTLISELEWEEELEFLGFDELEE